MPNATPLTLVHVDAEQGFSGGEVQVFLLLEGLRARGHRCVLVAPPGSRAEAEAGARGFEVRAVRMRGDADVFAVVELTRVLRALAPDVVHLHTGRATWLGALAARAAARPALSTRRMDRRVRRGWRTRLVYGRLLARVAAISPAVARCLEEGGVDRARVAVVPSTIDPRRVAPVRGRAAARAALGLEDDDVAFLALASLVPRKGLDVLVRARARLARRGDARDERALVFVAGDGPERGALEALARGEHVSERVRFLGARADVGDLLAACDAFVLPSRREGLGVSALEAMAAGRAVVASRVGGLAEAVVHERTGLLVPPDDVDALADALSRLVREPATRARLGAAGPARVAEGFLPEQMVDAYETLYREIAGEAAARARATSARGGA